MVSPVRSSPEDIGTGNGDANKLSASTAEHSPATESTTAKPQLNGISEKDQVYTKRSVENHV